MTLQSEDMGKLVAGISGAVLPGKIRRANPMLHSVKDVVAPEVIAVIAEVALAFRPAHSEAQPESKGHGPECWGRTSFSDEVAHCLCKPEAQPESDGGGEAARYARLICESEGKNWLGLDNSRADCERWLRSGQYLANARHPTPEGQTEGSVTQDMVDAAVQAWHEHAGKELLDTTLRACILAALASKGA